ncbi:polysulfide reductase [Desulfosporosinus orientis DSM 765]|uniref:Polysulfide reductase n=1 Tax=Desulfosporosinus orientis (strain ATCC 19365 / DSM 765 / NCIMB 8382 / VKM B-1628 / Singapore I) TaxID=768706 RepID=G7W6E6_DESOD|nr:NrfD/PsrC family molybdoenzyme membrane anchor subunit [Desulfosporosinus orientis]AET68153.1 polysulfide reductase [Desulfosporosinus orientis DSM 765]
MSTQTTFEKNEPVVSNSGLILAGVLAAAGIAAWIYQLIRGMQVTGISQQVVWGLYIAAFFTAAGGGAGLLALIGLSEFKPLLSLDMKIRLLSLTLAAYVIAGLLITMDVGSPMNLWRLLLVLPKSMMSWDLWIFAVSALITLYYLFKVRKADSLQPLKGLGILAIILAAALVTVEGWMISTLAAHPFWGSGMTVVSFLAGAVIAGLGLALLVLPKEGFLKSAFTGMLILNAVLVLAEVLTGLLAKTPLTHGEINLILTSPISIFFWFQMIFGLVVPLYLLLKNRLAWAGGLAITGILAEKVWLLAAGQAQPWMPGPESIYLPSWLEFIAVIGIAALGVPLFKLFQRWAAPANK